MPAKTPNGAVPTTLNRVLGQSERATDLVKESADELATVNAVLNEEVGHQETPPAVAVAIEMSQAVEKKVEEASEKLAAVNLALEGEIRDRDLVDHQLAAAQEQERAARHAAFHDALTSLPNRALFTDRLEHGLAQATRHGLNLAVMFLDLDDFKIINDLHGHAAGDSVLKTIAGRLKANTRGDDTVSRHGGDEFLYLLMEVRDERDIALIAQKLIDAIQAPCPVDLPGGSISPKVRASVGISMFPKHGATAEALIKSADLAMYRAKESGAGFAFAA